METGRFDLSDRVLAAESLPAPAPHMTLFKITYASGEYRVRGYLLIPESPEPLPGLIYCRGGIGRVGSVRIPRILSFAEKGYVVFAPFYRGNDGGEGRDRFGGDDRHDVYEAVELLRSLPQVSPLPIPLIGFSRGSIMALLAAKECPFAGPAVVWGGVSDLLLTYEERIELRRMLKRVVGHPVKDREAYLERSPVYWADQIRTPVMIVHGTEDANVGVRHAYLLEEALKQAGVEHVMELYQGLEHVFPEEVQTNVLNRMDQWIRGHILDR
jgi:dipeptidyl aminopeptidase/acylaminoacyl peptidase